MPRPVKQDRPVIAEPVVEATQGSTILVIQPGSYTLLVGRVADHQPQRIPHVIARRRNDGDDLMEDGASEGNPLLRRGISSGESERKREMGFQAANSFLQTMRTNCGFRRSKCSQQEVSNFNKGVTATISENNNSTSWTDVSTEENFFIGEQALNISPEESYRFDWPIRGGRLNRHSDVGGSPSAIATDLEAIWGASIETYLDIPLEHLCFYRAVLLIPDQFEPSDVKLMVDVLLNRLKFDCVIVNQESVSACLGAGISSACVVDVGDQKTSICCVEDGLSLIPTRIMLKYGGSDISRSFLWLLQKSSFPYKSIDISNNRADGQLLKELKETFCHLNFEIAPGHVHEFEVIRTNQTFELKLGDEPMLAPSCLFIPDLIGITGEKLLKVSREKSSYDPEDIMDHRHVLKNRDIRRQKQERGDGDIAITMETMSDGEMIIEPPSQISREMNQSQVSDHEHDGMPLEDAIIYSIEQCGNSETKRKMYSSVLLVGGGLNFKGADDFLLQRLKEKLPQHFQLIREQMELLTRPKDLESMCVAWKGGAVLSLLDSAQELWISRKEWNRYGVRILRERCAFQWSTNPDIS